MITLAGYANIRCGDTCAVSGCDTCPVEFNSWLPYIFQEHSECNWDDPGGRPQYAPGFTSDQIADSCLCCETRPLLPKCAPSEPVHENQGGGYFAWWYDPVLPNLSGRALGFIVHEFTLEDPMDFSAARSEKLRGRVSLVPGLMLGEMMIEAVGVDKASTRWLFQQAKAELEGLDVCCGREMDVYTHCCDEVDGRTGLRVLSDVAEFNVVEVDGTATLSDCGTMFSVVFSAAPLVSQPDAKIAAAATVDLGSVALPACPADTQSVNETTFTPKIIRPVDLELQPDGTLKVCAIDTLLTGFNSATDYMDVREVRAVTLPCCPLEIDLDVTTNPPTYTPLQPLEWQTEILDKITAGDDIDCFCPPVVRNLTVRNPNFNENFLGDPCDCPPIVHARDCADLVGLVLDADGLIDMNATSLALDAAPFPGAGLTYTQVYPGAAPAINNTATAMLNYLTCLQYYAVPWLSYGGGNGCNGAGLYEVLYIGPNGEVLIEPYDAAGALVCTTGCNLSVLDAPGMSYFGLDPCTGETITPKPIPVKGEEGDCVSIECQRNIVITPTGTGPCVTITLDDVGGATSSINSEFNDLANASFDFAPCSAISSAADCPAIIPPSPAVDVDTGTAIATPAGGWAGPGYLWPHLTTGADYTINNVDAVTNDPTPATSLVAVTRRLVDVTCDPPCGPLPLAPLAFIDNECFDAAPGDHQVLYREATGLSTRTLYRPDWSVTADGDLVQPTVYLWTGPAGSPAPTLPTVDDFICESAYSVTRVKEIGAGRQIRYGANGLQFQCSDGTFRPALNGWVDASRPWDRPEVCGAGAAFLLVVYEEVQTAPTVEFCMTPIGTL